MTRGSVSEWATRLEAACVAALDEAAATAAAVPPPTVHLLVGRLDPPYVGFVACRPFYRGEDAARAIAGMGVFASMLAATRLVVSFENADLVTALQLPGAERAPTALVVVDAERRGHTVRWHPLLMQARPQGLAGPPSVATSWGAVSSYPGVALPEPVDELLALWRAPRSWSDVDVLRVYARMATGGYAVRWARRRAGERGQPSWLRLLAPAL